MTEIKRLHYETVTPLLRETLGVLMQEELFSPFRLVGGTNLSLRYGHENRTTSTFSPMQSTGASISGHLKCSCGRASRIITAPIPLNSELRAQLLCR